MIGKVLLNKYRIIRQIGEGSYSTVYEAQHMFKLTKVAVKFDYDEVSKRLIENEIENYIYLQRNNMSEIAGIKSFGKLEDRIEFLQDRLLELATRSDIQDALIKIKANDPQRKLLKVTNKETGSVKLKVVTRDGEEVKDVKLS